MFVPTERLLLTYSQQILASKPWPKEIHLQPKPIWHLWRKNAYTVYTYKVLAFIYYKCSNVKPCVS